MTNLIDYFAVLEINPNATIDEINRAYRKQALLWHPDKQKTQNERLIAEERFKLIGEAYECLSNLGLRKQYDEVFNREKNNCSDFQSQARLAQLVKLFHEQHGLYKNFFGCLLFLGLVGFFPLHEINIVDVMTVRHSFSVDPFLNIYLQSMLLSCVKL